MHSVVKRFLKYVKYDTQADDQAVTFPSTSKQLILAEELVKELKDLGLSDVELDANGYVLATLPANCDRDIPVIGFIAHMDTAIELPGANVKARIIENYDGQEISLDKDKKYLLSPREFPVLKNYIGQSLITTDGTTLLGADDKAGIAEIFTALEYLIQHPEIKHGSIKIAITPDEEIGRGADFFDVKRFGADYAYTIDGGEIGQLEYECFNAAGVKITIRGKNIHPGKALGIMINSMRVAFELNAMLPQGEKPEYTDHYQGFFHLLKMEGDVEKTTMDYLIRDHDRQLFESKKDLLVKAAAFLNEKYGPNTIELDIKDSYYNMREKIEPHFHIIESAKKAMQQLDITVISNPIRGGTDGARLSYMGLPCPNIFTGGHNAHGRFEFIPIPSMIKAVQVIVKIIELSTQ